MRREPRDLAPCRGRRGPRHRRARSEPRRASDAAAFGLRHAALAVRVYLPPRARGVPLRRHWHEPRRRDHARRVLYAHPCLRPARPGLLGDVLLAGDLQPDDRPAERGDAARHPRGRGNGHHSPPRALANPHRPSGSRSDRRRARGERRARQPLGRDRRPSAHRAPRRPSREAPRSGHAPGVDRRRHRPRRASGDGARPGFRGHVARRAGRTNVKKQAPQTPSQAQPQPEQHDGPVP